MTNPIHALYLRPKFGPRENAFFVTVPDFINPSLPSPFFIEKSIDEPWSDAELENAVELRISLSSSLNEYTQKDHLIRAINKTKNLRSLGVPADFVGGVNPDILKNLNSLRIWAPSSMNLFQKILETKEYSLPDIHFPKLRILEFYMPFKYFTNFHPAHFPALTWAAMELEDQDKSGASMKCFNEFKKFDGFQINSVKVPDLLSKIRTDITALYLWSIRSRKFGFDVLATFGELKHLWLHGFSGDFDFKWISSLSQLESIQITSFNAFQNIQEIYKLEKLKSIELQCSKIKIKSHDLAELQKFCTAQSIELAL